MEININSNFGNIGIGREAFDANAVGSGGEAKGANREAKDAVVFTSARPTSLASSEPVADVSDAALRRDDELGKLVGAAFNLPPPAMPSFN